MPQSLRVTDLRRRNRALILRAIAMGSCATRAELAHVLSLSTGTVTNVLTDLIDEGYVFETGSVPSNGGRPTAQLGVVEDSACFIGADVGEHGVEAAVFGLGLDSVDSVFVPLSPRSTTPGQLREAVGRSVRDLLAANPAVAPRLRGIGLGLPGIVDTDEHGATTVYAQSLGWPPIPLAELSPDVGVPVLADNGAKTFAAAEMWSGAARGSQHSLVVLIGRGIGVGIISSGWLMRGAFSSAGEWGHTKIVVGGRRCTCGGRGCVEAYVGGSAVRARAEELGLPTEDTDEHSLTTLIALADREPGTARTLLEETVEYFGVGLANLVNIFNPERIVIGGWAGHLLFAARGGALTDAVRRHALHRPAAQVTLTQSTGSVDPIALGAALLPLERFIEGTLTAEEQA